MKKPFKGKPKFGRDDKRPSDRKSRMPEETRRPEKRRTEERPVTNVVFGVLPVIELLKAGSRRVEKLFIADGAREHRLREAVELARREGIIVSTIDREKLATLTGAESNNQGIAVITSAAEYSTVDDILDSIEGNALLVLLDGVEDPRNVGAVIRTVEGAGADGVIIPERRAAGLTETAAKASAGAIEYVKVAKTANINRLIEELKSKNIWVVGTDGDAKMDHTEWDWTQPSALVMGGEGSGLHRLVAENCDVLVKIPMYGKINSLNVSVATGVVLFEARRQRSKSS